MPAADPPLAIHSPDRRFTLTLSAAGDILRFYERTGDGREIDYFHRPDGNRCPLMHPWCNRVEAGTFSFEGETHILRPLHGAENNALHGNWLLPWTTRKKDGHSIVLEMRCRAEDGARDPACRTPYEYDIRQTLTLSNEGLNADMSVTNQGRTLPFGLGLHPFLPRPQDTIVRMDAARMENCGPDMIPDKEHPVIAAPPAWTLPGGFNISDKNLGPAARGFNTADLMDNCFTGIDPARGATIRWPGAARQMKITASANCRFGVIFVPGAANDAPPGALSYFCLELCTNGINMQNRPAAEAGQIVLKAGEKLAAQTRFTISAL